MSISNRWLATLIIGILWVLTSVAVVSFIPFTYSILFMLVIGAAAFGVASAITYAILTAYDNGRAQTGFTSRRQGVEKLLRELDDRDLDVLRERLSFDSKEEDYGSLEDLLPLQKRKNH